MSSLTLGSLFDGIAGFPLAFARAGVETRWVVEIDAACRRVSARHFPQATAYADVRDCGAHNLAPVDIITFGSPCQDLSVAGRRAGIDGARSGLFFEAVRIVRELRPRYAIWENVPGALSSNGGRDFGAALDALADAGAVDIAWRVLDARWFGVAQRRRRVFVVADFGGERAGQILFEPEGGRRDSAPRRAAGQGAARGAANGAGVSRPLYYSHDYNQDRVYEPHGAAPALTAQDSNQARNFLVPQVVTALRSNPYRDHDSDHGGLIPVGELAHSLRAQGQLAHREDVDTLVVAHALLSPEQGETAEGHDASEDGTGRGTPLVVAHSLADSQRGELFLSDVTNALTGGGGKPGQGYPAVAFTERTRADGRNVEAQEELAYSLNNPGAGGRTQENRVVTPALAVRRLTPLECCRLQGYADDYLDDLDLSDSSKYRMLGNSIAVPVVAWIARRMVEGEQ